MDLNKILSLSLRWEEVSSCKDPLPSRNCASRKLFLLANRALTLSCQAPTIALKKCSISTDNIPRGRRAAGTQPFSLQPPSSSSHPSVRFFCPFGLFWSDFKTELLTFEFFHVNLFLSFWALLGPISNVNCLFVAEGVGVAGVAVGTSVGASRRGAGSRFWRVGRCAGVKFYFFKTN